MAATTESQTYWLGVDGGGTNCRIRLVGPDGHVLGDGGAGSANTTLGLDVTFRAIETALSRLLDRLMLDHSIISQLHVGAGLAGLVDEEEIHHCESYDHPYASFKAVSDATAACLGAHGVGDGGVVIVGTGSVACSVQGTRTQQWGGWGFSLADQGSGAWVGLRALQESIQAADGLRPQSPLTVRILTHFEGRPADMLRWAQRATPRDYGAFAPWVVDATTAGDDLAVSLMRDAGKAISSLLTNLRLNDVSRVSILGGFAPFVLQWIDEAALQNVVPEQGDALDGALMIATGERKILEFS